MKQKQPYPRFMAALILSLSLALVLGAGGPQPAQAGTEDAAMFYDELSQHGEWVDYENHGPVWRPTQVEQDWRPYVNGRWVPTEQGQVFETQEPWGWATYHYGTGSNLVSFNRRLADQSGNDAGKRFLRRLGSDSAA
jgi:hypothetical protein